MYKNPDDSVGLTGVGYLNSEDKLVAPENREEFIAPEDRHKIPPEVVLYVGPSSTYETPSTEFGPQLPAFLVHDECWGVFLQRISYGHDVKEHLTDLIQIFYRVSYYKEAFDCHRHDFGDFQRMWSSNIDEYEDLVDNCGLGYVGATPHEFVDTQELLEYVGRAERPTRSETGSDISDESGSIDYDMIADMPYISPTPRLPEHGSTDPFNKLPTEVIDVLLGWIKTDDIWELLKASRAIASRSSPDGLPRSFWYSRFSPDFEMGFALPRNTEGFHDWEFIYFKIKWALKARSHICLRNRSRIWNFFWSEKRLYQKAFKKREDVSTSA